MRNKAIIIAMLIAVTLIACGIDDGGGVRPVNFTPVILPPSPTATPEN